MAISKTRLSLAVLTIVAAVSAMVIVPQAAGAPNDLMARIMAPEMSKILGQPVHQLR